MTTAGAAKTRPRVEGCGVTLIIVACLPLLVIAGGIGYLWFNTHRARVAAGEAREGVRIGSPLSEAIRSSSERVGTLPFLQCYQAMCIDPVAVVLVRRTGSSASIIQLPQADQVRCSRAQITFCGRPFMTFVVELDGSQRVSKVGPLTFSAD